MKQLYSQYFPTPSYLAMSSCSFDISDKTVKYGELKSTPEGLRLGRYGQVKMPIGIVVSGKIEEPEKLIQILKDIAKRLNLRFARVSLPEEQMYLFTLSIPKMNSDGDIRQAILFQIEEHIPLKAEDTVFDYDIVKDGNDNITVEVVAIARGTIESYLYVFKEAGLTPIAFELEAQAIARSVIPNLDKNPVMIVDFGESRTGVSIAHSGRVLFTTTLDIGGVILTNMISKNFSLTFDEAEKLKHTYDNNDKIRADEVFPVILGGLSVLRDELNKHYIYWKTHSDDGEHKSVDRLIICGGGANLPGVADYLEASMKIKIDLANVWVNILDITEVVPKMSHQESLNYATVLGLALGDYVYNSKSLVNVLPDREKNSLVKEYWVRLLIISILLFIITCLSVVVLLFPSYYLSKTKETLASNQLDGFKSINPEINDGFVSKVNNINSKLALLSPVNSNHQMSDKVFDKLPSMIPKGITVSKIFYNERSDMIRTLEIHGQAENRDSLSSLKQILDSDPDFLSVELPISSYLERVNLSFSISIILK